MASIEVILSGHSLYLTIISISKPIKVRDHKFIPLLRRATTIGLRASINFNECKLTACCVFSMPYKGGSDAMVSSSDNGELLIVQC